MKSIKTIIFISLITFASLLMAMDSDEMPLTADDLALISSEQAWDDEEKWADAYRKVQRLEKEELTKKLMPQKNRIMEQFKALPPQEIIALSDDALWKIMECDAQTPKLPVVYNEIYSIIHLILKDKAVPNELDARLCLFNRENIFYNIPAPNDVRDVRYRRYLMLHVQRIENDLKHPGKRQQLEDTDKGNE